MLLLKGKYMFMAIWLLSLIKAVDFLKMFILNIMVIVIIISLFSSPNDIGTEKT
jgi:hypothetical protein